MLNYKFANKLNLPWDGDNNSEQSSLSLSLWLLLGFERDSLSPFFAPTDCGRGSQQPLPLLLLFGSALFMLFLDFSIMSHVCSRSSQTMRAIRIDPDRSCNILSQSNQYILKRCSKNAIAHRGQRFRVYYYCTVVLIYCSHYCC